MPETQRRSLSSRGNYYHYYNGCGLLVVTVCVLFVLVCGVCVCMLCACNLLLQLYMCNNVH